ncbi:MAG: 16S rRNA (cytosine(1402)-N(4))-methyltransferase RsmH, partial [Caulobacteraceae bacterium]
MSAEPHIPVMLADVAEALRPGPGRLMVDATFGAGGYSRAFLAAGADVAAFDRDPAVRPLAARFETEGSFRFFLAPFSAMTALLGEGMADGVAMDLGVSSMQLEAAERGFSLRRDGPLDMRMGEGGRTAAEIVNSASEAELVTIFRDFGEEPRARAVARAIIRRRAERPFARTLELAEAVTRAKGGPRGARIHPATRVFQALRIAVNGELQELAAGLE